MRLKTSDNDFSKKRPKSTMLTVQGEQFNSSNLKKNYTFYKTLCFTKTHLLLVKV